MILTRKKSNHMRDMSAETCLLMRQVNDVTVLQQYYMNAYAAVRNASASCFVAISGQNSQVW